VKETVSESNTMPPGTWPGREKQHGVTSVKRLPERLIQEIFAGFQRPTGVGKFFVTFTA